MEIRHPEAAEAPSVPAVSAPSFETAPETEVRGLSSQRYDAPSPDQVANTDKPYGMSLTPVAANENENPVRQVYIDNKTGERVQIFESAPSEPLASAGGGGSDKPPEPPVTGPPSDSEPSGKDTPSNEPQRDGSHETTPPAPDHKAGDEVPHDQVAHDDIITAAARRWEAYDEAHGVGPRKDAEESTDSWPPATRPDPTERWRIHSTLQAKQSDGASAPEMLNPVEPFSLPASDSTEATQSPAKVSSDVPEQTGQPEGESVPSIDDVAERIGRWATFDNQHLAGNTPSSNEADQSTDPAQWALQNPTPSETSDVMPTPLVDQPASPDAPQAAPSPDSEPQQPISSPAEADSAVVTVNPADTPKKFPTEADRRASWERVPGLPDRPITVVEIGASGARPAMQASSPEAVHLLEKGGTYIAVDPDVAELDDNKAVTSRAIDKKSNPEAAINVKHVHGAVEKDGRRPAELESNSADIVHIGNVFSSPRIPLEEKMAIASAAADMLRKDEPGAQVVVVATNTAITFDREKTIGLMRSVGLELFAEANPRNYDPHPAQDEFVLRFVRRPTEADEKKQP